MSISRIDEAFALMASDEAEAAAPVLAGVLEAAPGYAPVYVLYARASEALHAWPQALKLWQSALLLVPSLRVAREGVLRATRVIAALNDLDQQTAADPTPDVAQAMGSVAGGARASQVAGAESNGAAPMRPRPLGKSALGAPPAPPLPAPSPEPPALPIPDPGLDADPASADALPEDAVFAAPPPPPGVFRAPPMPPSAPPPAARPFDLDLDGLIEQLNTQGRITPRPDLDRIPAPDLDDDGEDMVSETLARIYATQGQYDEAARIYELLAAQQPHNAEAFQREARTLRGRAGDE